MSNIVRILIGMLLITTTFSTIVMATEYEEKYTVYISGRYLTDYDNPHSIKHFDLWHLSLFRGNQSGNWVNFSFTQKTLIILITNNKPRIIQGPVNLNLSLTEPETFMFLWWPPFSLIGIGRAKIFGVCDSIDIFEH